MSVELIRYDAACQAIAKAKTVDVAAKIRNSAEAMRAYAKVAKNRELEIDAAEIRIRAERRIGELIAAQRQTVGLAKGGRPSKKTASKSDAVFLTLKEAGIGVHLADRARRLEAVELFEELIAEWRARLDRDRDRVTTNLLREGDRETRPRVVRPLPPGQFRLLYADPPWQYEHVKTESRAVENQYPTMTLEQICALEVPAADDAVLFLWATSPKLAEALTVVSAWGFTYRTCAVWDKGVIGMGYYFRQQHELLLVAGRGELPVPEPSARPASVFRSPRTKHSAKPVFVYEMLEQMYPTFTEADRAELFARQTRPGWTPWGNEEGVCAVTTSTSTTTTLQ